MPEGGRAVITASAQKALNEWYKLDSADGLGAALHVGQMLAAVLEHLSAQRSSDGVRDRVAQAMCLIEVRSTASTLEEVAAGIPRWTRHRYEAERLIEELAEHGLKIVPAGAVTENQNEAL